MELGDPPIATLVSTMNLTGAVARQSPVGKIRSHNFRIEQLKIVASLQILRSIVNPGLHFRVHSSIQEQRGSGHLLTLVQRRVVTSTMLEGVGRAHDLYLQHFCPIH